MNPVGTTRHWPFIQIPPSSQILAEMLARGLIGREGQPSALLLAPTTSLVASVACQSDAALRVGDLASRPSTASDSYTAQALADPTTTPTCHVHVVHGRYDETSFCPNQQRYRGIGGLRLHILPDNHVLCLPETLRFLTQLLEELLAETQRQQTSGSV